MNSPFFSVVIPVYNKEQHIARSIKSVINQAFKDFELLIVCDPSTDNSNAEVKKFTDDRIRVFYRDKPGTGGYAARNLGIKEAKAEWIAFLDADDEWYSEHLKESYNLLLKHDDVSFVFFNYMVKKNDIVRKKHQITSTIFLTREKLLKLFSQNELIHTNSIVVRKRELLNAGLFPEGKTKRGGDNDLWLRLIIHSNCAVWSYKATSIYKMDNSEIISDPLSLVQKHIIAKTAYSMLKEGKLSKKESILLKKISNRKSISLMIIRKKHSLFKYRELRNIYYRYLSFGQFLLIIYLIIPSNKLNRIISTLSFSSSPKI
jgi:glycosyltransferase involved in cell wall biosynthesis